MKYDKEEYVDFLAEVEFAKSKERFLKEQKAIEEKNQESYYRELNQRIDKQLKNIW